MADQEPQPTGDPDAEPAPQAGDQVPSDSQLLMLRPKVEGDWHLAGDEISIQVVATNIGDIAAENLVIKPLAPVGMTADDSQVIPSLQPGDEVTLQVKARTERRNYFRPQSFDIDLYAEWESDGRFLRTHEETTVAPRARFMPDYVVGLLVGAAVGLLFYALLTPGLANAREWLAAIIDSSGQEWDGSFAEDIAWPAVSGVLWWLLVVAITWFVLSRMYRHREAGRFGGVTVSSWTGALMVGILAPWFIIGPTQGLLEGVVGIGDPDSRPPAEEITGEEEPSEPPPEEQPTEPPAEEEPTEPPAEEQPTEPPAEEGPARGEPTTEP